VKVVVKKSYVCAIVLGICPSSNVIVDFHIKLFVDFILVG
jgi:hypothetical protein